jgi:hypothetical protein
MLTHKFENILTEYLNITLEDFENYDLNVKEVNIKGDYFDITVFGNQNDIQTMINFFNGTEYI